MTNAHHPNAPTTYPEPPAHTAARALLEWVTADPAADIEDQLAAADALDALTAHVPWTAVLPAAEPVPGTIADAAALLTARREPIDPEQQMAGERANSRLRARLQAQP